MSESSLDRPDLMKMAQMVTRTSVSERLLRYYEQQGLLHPHRQANRYRWYSEDDVETVRRIRCLLDAGLNTDQVARVLPCLRDDEDRVEPRCPDLIADLRTQHAEITARITALTTSRGLLEQVLAGAPA